MDVPGEKLLIKLWESIADKGIGTLLKPWQIRREGRAANEMQRETMLVLAQAEVDAAAIRAGTKVLLPDGSLRDADRAQLELLAAPNSPALLLKYIDAAAQSNARAEAVRREISIAKAVLHAEEELAQDPQEPSSVQVSADWLLRWRDCAANVSSDQMQLLWGRVLAGEVKAPGRFSLRTLEFVRSLSQGEALAIQKLSAFVVQDFIYRDDKALNAEGVTVPFLLSMQELGLISGVATNGLSVSWDSVNIDQFERPLVSHGRVLMVKGLIPSMILRLQMYQITVLGRQVLQLGTFKPNEKYLRTLGAAIKAKGFDVEIGSYVQIDDDRIDIVSREPL